MIIGGMKAKNSIFICYLFKFFLCKKIGCLNWEWLSVWSAYPKYFAVPTSTFIHNISVIERNIFTHNWLAMVMNVRKKKRKKIHFVNRFFLSKNLAHNFISVEFDSPNSLSNSRRQSIPASKSATSVQLLIFK